MSDDAEARAQRAARLRERIAEVTGRPSGNEPEQPPAPSSTPTAPPARRNAPRVGGPPSWRSRVEERMRELDEGDGQTNH
jgi:hypothetical protein